MRKKTSSPIAETVSAPDLTPMLDVVFILLIFFVITASFIQEQTLQLESAPTHSSNDSQQKSALEVIVDERNRVYVGAREVPPQALAALLKQLRSQDENQGLVIAAHANAQTETYVSVLDAANAAQFNYPTLKLWPEK